MDGVTVALAGVQGMAGEIGMIYLTAAISTTSAAENWNVYSRVDWMLVGSLLAVRLLALSLVAVHRREDASVRHTYARARARRTAI
eukprot:COSAG02_NODE_439_length_22308_cov_18.013508_14_plen_86_part_00